MTIPVALSTKARKAQNAALFALGSALFSMISMGGIQSLATETAAWWMGTVSTVAVAFWTTYNTPNAVATPPSDDTAAPAAEPAPAVPAPAAEPAPAVPSVPFGPPMPPPAVAGEVPAP